MQTDPETEAQVNEALSTSALAALGEPASGDYELPERTSSSLQATAERMASRYRSVGDTVVEVLRAGILDGTLAPGQKLRQATVAEILGVSRVPVRAALIQLEAEGLVEADGRRGAHVKSLTPRQARELYDVRAVLEVEALRQAMAEMTPDRLERLRDLARIADDENHGAGFVAARAAFYGELYDAEERAVLWDTIERLRLKVGRFVLGWRLHDAPEHERTHTALVEAVASGDVERATAVLRGHLAGIRDAVVARLEADVPD